MRRFFFKKLIYFRTGPIRYNRKSKLYRPYISGVDCIRVFVITKYIDIYIAYSSVYMYMGITTQGITELDAFQ